MSYKMKAWFLSKKLFSFKAHFQFRLLSWSWSPFNWMSLDQMHCAVFQNKFELFEGLYNQMPVGEEAAGQMSTILWPIKLQTTTVHWVSVEYFVLFLSRRQLNMYNIQWKRKTAFCRILQSLEFLPPKRPPRTPPARYGEKIFGRTSHKLFPISYITAKARIVCLTWVCASLHPLTTD